jgi:hypothetical protein
MDRNVMSPRSIRYLLAVALKLAVGKAHPHVGAIPI